MNGCKKVTSKLAFFNDLPINFLNSTARNATFFNYDIIISQVLPTFKMSSCSCWIIITKVESVYNNVIQHLSVLILINVTF